MRTEGCGYRGSPIDAMMCYSTIDGSLIRDTGGVELDYDRAWRRATSIAKTLDAKHGVRRGDAVAIAPINSAESLLSLTATWLLGATAAIIDPLSHSMDLEMQLRQVSPRLLITANAFLDKHCDTARKLGIICVSAEQLYVEAGDTEWEGYYRPRSWENALIYFYAGIAGRTIPVIHTHSNVAASAEIVVSHYRLGQNDKVLVVAPISHALGLQISALAALHAGASITLYRRTGKMNTTEAVEIVTRENPSMILAVPMFYKSLLDSGYKGTPALKYPVSAGAPLPTDLQNSWSKVTGVELLQLYGMTEAAPVSATLPGENPLGSIGKPMPGIEVRLLNPTSTENGGAIGELLVRGPMVMKGYGVEAENERAFLPGGWLRTGDIIEVDRDGFMFFRGVKKRMIKYKGYPIFPRDLEVILEQHPAVARARVYGEPGGDVGQIPVAEVWLRKGVVVNEEELMEWVNSKVAPYKRIRRLVIKGYID
ncbi:class I adenylate-forming enzyme family protein [Pyrofollis japonicus]|uniref:class I adenylate-forming enzyme family protein n=1 Tax=Pyrofollis japonicus TaxID=3060460 RepID=UPI00295BCDD7|nr:class I adenylate-forming enzyme family protein [Pyrofollis japonicus]BEP16933.1 class I adenylate-forming enzyme family protein [Pyrofollis japonicus]